MLERLFDTPTFMAAEGALNGLSARLNAMSDNIANVNTPNYKAREVPFEAALERAVKAQTAPCTDAPSGPVRPFVPPVIRDTTTIARPDGNNVDIEREMVRVAENSLRYSALTEYVTTYFTGLKSLINGAK